MIPTPQQIFSRFEGGEIERDEMHALMALHARELIAEMEDDYQNPAAAWLESVLARRAAGRLVRRHGARLLREVFAALAEVPDFPPARYLWNANHPELPLHCFLRIRREPVFRILSIDVIAGEFRIAVEHGLAAKGQGLRQSFRLKRNAGFKLVAQPA
mgnify:FL=1